MIDPEDCPHENTDWREGPNPWPEAFCLDCGYDLSLDGPADDEWIARAYEAMS